MAASWINELMDASPHEDDINELFGGNHGSHNPRNSLSNRGCQGDSPSNQDGFPVNTEGNHGDSEEQIEGEIPMSKITKILKGRRQGQFRKCKSAKFTFDGFSYTIGKDNCYLSGEIIL